MLPALQLLPALVLPALQLLHTLVLPALQLLLALQLLPALELPALQLLPAKSLEYHSCSCKLRCSHVTANNLLHVLRCVRCRATVYHLLLWGGVSA